jgi:hypothetical protein
VYRGAPVRDSCPGVLARYSMGTVGILKANSDEISLDAIGTQDAIREALNRVLGGAVAGYWHGTRLVVLAGC